MPVLQVILIRSFTLGLMHFRVRCKDPTRLYNDDDDDDGSNNNSF